MIIKILKNQLIHGNAYELIKEIEDRSIDLIVTDPPYLISSSNSGKGKISASYQSLNEELKEKGLTNGIDLSILDEFMRVMKKPNIYIWCNKKQIIDYLNYFVLQHNCSFEILTWIKSNPIPAYGYNYLNDKEYCLYFRKGIRFHTDYASARTYWITPTNVKDKRKYNHPTIKPLSIIETLIKNSSSSGEVILDCFAGSGTTAVAAIKNNRKFIAIECDKTYYELAIKRLKEEIN